MDGNFARNVFVNCPFDAEYEPILQACLFCLIRFGLNPRIATERSDSGEVRLAKIKDLIRQSRYSIHDISRCQSSRADEPARLNMPFELGLDLGCRAFAGAPWDQKVVLVLEEKRHRYQVVLSDIAGMDIESHDADYRKAVRKVRNWLSSFGTFQMVGADRILGEYEDFQAWFLNLQRSTGFSDDDIRDFSTAELMNSMLAWIAAGQPRP